jgi:hypothetical protein
MDEAAIDRLRRVVLTHRPPRRLRVWRSWRAPVMRGLWREARGRVGWRRAWRLRHDWGWLWASRSGRCWFDPVQRRVGCPRGRHRYGHLVADELLGGIDALDYPELAICQLCGHTVQWPNGKPTLLQG